MSDKIKEFPAATEGAENATDAPAAPEGVNIPEGKKNATQQNAGGNAGVYVHKFKKPFEYEGKKYETLNFYFERLTTDDMINIENEMTANNEYALDPLLSRNYQILMASKAGGVGSDALKAMPFQDGYKISTAARDFLIDSGF